MGKLIVRLRYTTSVENFVRPDNLAAVLPALEEMDEILEGGSQIISAVSVIEHALCVLIADALAPAPGTQREFIVEEILGSDVINYAAKRRLTRSLISKNGALTERSLTELDKALKDLGTYRNAFAHGAIHHTPAGYELHSFDDARKKQRPIDEAFWARVQALFDRTYMLLDEASSAMSAADATPGLASAIEATSG